MWRAAMPDPDQVRRLKEARRRHDLRPLVIHDNYLINLAAEHAALREMSVAAFRGEVERALVLGAEFLVAHPGSYGGQGLERGLCRVVESLCRATRGLKVKGLTILIENTSGGGTRLGGCFEELRALRELAAEYLEAPVGFCLDTCHCLTSGYDVAGPAGLRQTIAKAESILGLEHVGVIHANDSKAPLGSHIDRHQHIGEGHIGAEGFRRILAHPKLRAKPFILETPRDKEGDDRRNVEMLKTLCRKKRTTTKRSS
jgi:deoxyribonuclease-4